MVLHLLAMLSRRGAGKPVSSTRIVVESLQCNINDTFMINLVRKMSQSTTHVVRAATSTSNSSSTIYVEAIRSLNSLQSNAAYINAAKQVNLTRNTVLQDMRKYLFRSGITPEQLDSFSVIHVAGTKGKGSTCAFVEAILHEHGFRTGFYSSPHLVSVRERFRINCQSISELEFSRHFWHVYNILDQKKENDGDMPQYFKFLTILMFHVFLKANVDVAILEVGIGGEYDCTNIVNSTVCVGITSLGLDHTSLLGNTLESIAYQKSGIFKPGALAFTVSQPNDAMSVLQDRSIEKNCPLSVVPNLRDYPWRKSVPTLGIQCSVQNDNASLAIQLASAWITRHESSKRIRCLSILESTENKIDIENLKISNGVSSPKKSTLCFKKVATALENCKWPGRTQVLLGRTLDFYIDGAHTDESMNCCVTWFQNIVKSTPDRKKYLIFNTTGDRDVAKLLDHLRKIEFVKAFFVPNSAGLIQSADQENFNTPVNKQIEKCRCNAEVWGENAVLSNSVYDALLLIRKGNDLDFSNEENKKPQVLVTGSLHLVGALLSIVDPDLRMSTTF